MKHFDLGHIGTLLNHPPTDISISENSITENNSVGDIIGAFSTTDADVGDTFTYEKVSGIGSTDNSSFTIDGANLKAAEIFEYIEKSSYSIRIKSTDNKGKSVEKVFEIVIAEQVTQAVSANATANSVLSVSSDDFNFSGGKPFSISMYNNMNNAAGNSSISRYDGSTVSYSFEIIPINSTYVSMSFIINATASATRIYMTKLVNRNSGWNHFCVTCNGSNLASGIDFYYNSVKQTSISINQDNLTEMHNATSVLYIGKNGSSLKYGTFDDLIIYNKKLSDLEVFELFALTDFRNISQLTSYSNIISAWGFDNSLLDLVSNNNFSATAPIYFNVRSSSYISTSGNDETAELNNKTLKYLTIDAAIIALRTAKIRFSKIKIEDGIYNSPSILTTDQIIDGIEFIGTTRPSVDSLVTPTKLVEGTILRGILKYQNIRRLAIKNIGVDVGLDWATNVNSGTATDAINITGGCEFLSAKNCIALVKEPSSLFHAFLTQQVNNILLENITTYYGVHGVVFKGNNIVASDINANGHNLDGLIIKMDNVIQNTKNIQVNGFKYRNLNNNAQYSISFDNTTAQYIDNVTILNADLDGETIHGNGNLSNILVKDTSENISYQV